VSLVRLENPARGERPEISCAKAAALISSQQAVATIAVDGEIRAIRLLAPADRRRESAPGYDAVDRCFLSSAANIPLIRPERMMVTRRDKEAIARKRNG